MDPLIFNTPQNISPVESFEPTIYLYEHPVCETFSGAKHSQQKDRFNLFSLICQEAVLVENK